MYEILKGKKNKRKASLVVLDAVQFCQAFLSFLFLFLVGKAIISLRWLPFCWSKSCSCILVRMPSRQLTLSYPHKTSISTCQTTCKQSTCIEMLVEILGRERIFFGEEHFLCSYLPVTQLRRATLADQLPAFHHFGNYFD